MNNLTPLWEKIKRLFSGRSLGHNEVDFVSIVMLQRQPKNWSEEEFRVAAQRAWNIPFAPDDHLNNFVAGLENRFVIKGGGHFISVLAGNIKYGDNPDEIHRSIKDLRRRKVWSEHAAWTALDYISGQVKPPRNQRYGIIAKLIAELLSDNCVGLCLPAEDHIVPSGSDLGERLRKFTEISELWTLGDPFVVQFSDRELEQAVAEARRRWPEFVAAFAGRRAGEKFFVKAEFGDSKNTEWMWVDVDQVDEEYASGLLDNNPVDVPSLKAGDRVKTDAAKIGDWTYIRNENIYGLFTKNVMDKPSSQE